MLVHQLSFEQRTFWRSRYGPIVVLPAPTPGTFFDTQVWTESGRVDCCPELFTPAIARCHDRLCDTVLPLADVVFVSAPHTPQSEGMMGPRQFELPPKSPVEDSPGS